MTQFDAPHPSLGPGSSFPHQDCGVAGQRHLPNEAGTRTGHTPGRLVGNGLTVAEYLEDHSDGRKAGEWVVHIRGEVDLANSAELLLVLHRAVASHPRVCCDLRELAFLGAAGLGVLIRVHQAARWYGGHLRVRGAQELPATVLRVTGVERLLNEA